MSPRRKGSSLLLLFLASRGLLRSPLIFAMLVLAVAAGESFQIPNTANIAGYESELIAQGVSTGAGEVRVRPKSGPRFADGDALAKGILGVATVRAVVPVLILPGALGIGGRWEAAPVLGINDNASRRPYRLPDGAPLQSNDHDGILVGGLLAKRLGVKVNSPVELRVILDVAALPSATPSQVPSSVPSPPPSSTASSMAKAPPGAPPASATASSNAQVSPAAPPPSAVVKALPNAPDHRAVGSYSMIARGIMRGAFTADEVVVVDRRFLIEEVGTSGAASILFVYSDVPSAAVPLARQIEAQFPGVEARAWTEDSAFLGGAIKGNRALNAISSAMAMIGVAIPVWALLYVSVAQRRREIGLYGALGFGAPQVFTIFLLQALVVGLLGVALGAAGGYGAVRYFTAHPLFKDDSFVIRPALSLAALVRSVLTILGTTVAAGVVPALRAARVDPARALRGIV